MFQLSSAYDDYIVNEIDRMVTIRQNLFNDLLKYLRSTRYSKDKSLVTKETLNKTKQNTQLKHHVFLAIFIYLPVKTYLYE